jgi:hypothetical protein
MGGEVPATVFQPANFSRTDHHEKAKDVMLSRGRRACPEPAEGISRRRFCGRDLPALGNFADRRAQAGLLALPCIGELEFELNRGS